MTVHKNTLLILWIYWFDPAISIVPCPPPNSQCDCEYSGKGYVYCRGATSLPMQLPSNVTFLDLDSNMVGSILLKKQIDELGNMSLFQLFLSGTGVEAIESRAFQGQSQLLTLDLSKNDLSSLQDGIFYGLSRLESLILADSSVYEISFAVFADVPSLAYLDLSDNKLTKIGYEFAALTELRTLILSNNQISAIADASFQSLSHLHALDISGNQLTVPKASLFQHIVSNNGTVTLQRGDKKNEWDCCGSEVTEYYEFLSELMGTQREKQFDITCSSPPEILGQMLSQISMTVCGEPVAFSGILQRASLIVTDVETESTTTIAPAFDGSLLEGRAPQYDSKKWNNPNSFSRLSDAQIAMILIAIIVIVIAVTAFIVRQCVIEKRKKIFGEFVDNLPSAMEVDDDDSLPTTKTYRHDAPVYGSTGNVVDRHQRRADYATYSIKQFPAGQPTPKRRPPPYDPPSSPEGFAEAYEKPSQFNNNSSTAANDFYGYQNMLRRIASCPTEYDSDDGNVLWNKRNVKK